MTATAIPTGTANWDVPVNAALLDLQGQATSLQGQVTGNGSRLTALEATPATKTGAVAGSIAYAAQVTGDTVARYTVGADGKLNWGPGGATATDTALYRSAVGALTTDGFFAMNAGQAGGAFTAFTGAPKALVCGSSGGGLAIKEGAQGRLGTAVLVAGTATVANSAISSAARIFLTTQVPGGTVGTPYVSARTAGTSFTITSTSGTDTSTVAYFLVEPA